MADTSARDFEQDMQDASGTDDERYTRALAAAVKDFFEGRGCSVSPGPAMAYFETFAAGGATRRRYLYQVLAQGGWKDRAEGRGEGCESYDDLRAVFLALLANWTKPELPIIVRDGPLVERHPQTGKWYGYFRFVQLDFHADEEIMVLLPLNPASYQLKGK